MGPPYYPTTIEGVNNNHNHHNPSLTNIYLVNTNAWLNDASGEPVTNNLVDLWTSFSNASSVINGDSLTLKYDSDFGVGYISCYKAVEIPSDPNEQIKILDTHSHESVYQCRRTGLVSVKQY